MELVVDIRHTEKVPRQIFTETPIDQLLNAANELAESLQMTTLRTHPPELAGQDSRTTIVLELQPDPHDDTRRLLTGLLRWYYARLRPEGVVITNREDRMLNEVVRYAFRLEDESHQTPETIELTGYDGFDQIMACKTAVQELGDALLERLA